MCIVTRLHRRCIVRNRYPKSYKLKLLPDDQPLRYNRAEFLQRIYVDTCLDHLHDQVR